MDSKPDDNNTASSIDKEGIPEPELTSVSSVDLDNWRQEIEQLSLTHKELYLVSDTETTGTLIVDSVSKLFNRVLEWGMVLCIKDEQDLLSPVIDSKGRPIIINEPINPFIEPIKNKRQLLSTKSIDKESTQVHGLTLNYLFGKEDGLAGRPSLKAPAPYFEMVFFALQRLFNFSAFLQGDLTVYLVFHNAPFDIGFLNHEMELAEAPPIESFFIPLDTLRMAKKIIAKEDIPEGYSLDNIFAFGQTHYPDHIKETARPYHGALIDSFILMEVWNVLQLHQHQKGLSVLTDDEDTEILEYDGAT